MRAAALLMLFLCACQRQELPPLQEYSLGGDFALTDQRGAPFRLQDLQGKVVLLFFGYTACPDACPTTLARISRACDLLEAGRDRVVTVFITVDPARDTTEQLSRYLGYFDLHAIGLTGSEEQVRQVASQYGAGFARGDSVTGGGYLMEHTDRIFLLDPQGKLRYLFSQTDPPELIAGLIGRVL